MTRDGRRDFDFLHGRWHVRNERLRERLANSTDWERFEATTTCQPLLGGVGNLETFATDWNGGYRGLALRLYAPSTRRWSIHWASDRSGELQPPVQGGFDGDVGTFTGEDEVDVASVAELVGGGDEGVEVVGEAMRPGVEHDEAVVPAEGGARLSLGYRAEAGGIDAVGQQEDLLWWQAAPD